MAHKWTMMPSTTGIRTGMGLAVLRPPDDVKISVTHSMVDSGNNDDDLQITCW
jgi:hypothetical protein